MDADTLAIGIDLGGTKIDIAIVDGSGRLLDRVKIATEVQKGPIAIIAAVVSAVETLKKRVDSRKLKALGVAVAGQIEPSQGVVKFAPNLYWHQVEIGRLLKEALGLPVTVTNDVRAATYGEWQFGAGRGKKNLTCLMVGTGIGGGIVAEGVMLSGETNSTGEVGHMVVSYQGEPCTCGNRGCWETLAGGWGIARRTKEAVVRDPGRGAYLLRLVQGNVDALSARHLFDSAKQGDVLSVELVEEISKALIAGTTSLVNILNPECLIFGGGVITGAPWLVDRISEGVRRFGLKNATERLQIVSAELGGDSAVRGVAALAIESQNKRISRTEKVHL